MAQESLLRTCFDPQTPGAPTPYPAAASLVQVLKALQPPARLEKTRLADHPLTPRTACSRSHLLPPATEAYDYEFRRNTRKAIPKSICDNSRHSMLTLPWLNELATKKQKETPLVDQTPHLGGCA